MEKVGVYGCKMIAFILLISMLFVGCASKKGKEVVTNSDQFTPTVINTREDLSRLFNYDFTNVELCSIRAVHIVDKGKSDPISRVGVIFKKPEIGCLGDEIECEFCDVATSEQTDPSVFLRGLAFEHVYYELFNFRVSETIDKTVTHMGSWTNGYKKMQKSSNGEIGEVVSETSVKWAVSQLKSSRNDHIEDEYVVMVIGDPLHFVVIGDIQNELIFT